MFNPLEVTDRVIQRLRGGGSVAPLRPWTRGFKGSTAPVGDGFECTGLVSVKKGAIEVTGSLSLLVT